MCAWYSVEKGGNRGNGERIRSTGYQNKISAVLGKQGYQTKKYNVSTGDAQTSWTKKDRELLACSLELF